MYEYKLSPFFTRTFLVACKTFYSSATLFPKSLAGKWKKTDNESWKLISPYNGLHLNNNIPRNKSRGWNLGITWSTRHSAEPFVFRNMRMAGASHPEIPYIWQLLWRLLKVKYWSSHVVVIVVRETAMPVFLDLAVAMDTMLLCAVRSS